MLSTFGTLLAAADPLSHVQDKTLIKGPVLFEVGGNPLITADPLTMNTLTLLIAAVLTIFIMRKAAAAIETGQESQGNSRFLARGAFGNLIEVIVLYLRDTVIRPQLGHDASKFTPFLLTLFFFILVNNLLGLVPLIDVQYLIGQIAFEDYKDAKVIGGTATGRLGVTAGLAVFAFVVWNLHGIRSNGFGGWAKHFLGGAPAYLAPLMLIVELMGLLIKPVALAVRLFANMTAGHILLSTLVLLPFLIFPALGGLAFAATPVTFVAAMAIFCLEIFVAVLQAFIFFFLTTIFLSQMSHHGHGHDDEHGDEHGLGAVPVAA